VLALWRDAYTADGGNKQGTSSCESQPNATTSRVPRTHARSGQPLAVTVNRTVCGLTHKQEARCSSPSPPNTNALQTGISGRASLSTAALPNRRREQATRHAASTRSPPAGAQLAILRRYCARPHGEALFHTIAVQPPPAVCRMRRAASAAVLQCCSRAKAPAPRASASDSWPAPCSSTAEAQTAMLTGDVAIQINVPRKTMQPRARVIVPSRASLILVLIPPKKSETEKSTTPRM
jgi:hypothetical protein